MSGDLDLTITSININSFNVSTMGGEIDKTYIKIEGITGKRSDVIFIIDTIKVGHKGKGN